VSINDFISRLKSFPASIGFADTMQLIDDFYIYQPTAFRNGDIINAAGSNEGSCKILAFARLQNFSKEQTLNCFGDYYRVEVLQHPDSDNHPNIRQFMRTGWDAVQINDTVLKIKDIKSD